MFLLDEHSHNVKRKDSENNTLGTVTVLVATRKDKKRIYSHQWSLSTNSKYKTLRNIRVCFTQSKWNNHATTTTLDK